MHILFPYLARYKAANWTRYHHLFGKLAEMGHRITVLQPPPADLAETNFMEIEVDLPENIVLQDVKMPGWFWNRRWPKDKLIKKGSYGIACKGDVARIMATDPVDAMIVYNLPQAGLLALKPPSGEPPVRIFDLADDYEAMLQTELGRAGFGLILKKGRQVLRGMIRDADQVLCISHSLAEDYPEEDIEILPNGVDFSRFDAAYSEIEKREPDSRPVIGYLGALEYFIDFEMILQTARLLPDCTFRLIGGGRDEQAIRRRVTELGLGNVELPGTVPFDQVPMEIGRMDICLNLFELIPISHKASPMKLFEYLAMGKPVLTTALDEIGRYQADFLETVGSPEETAATIGRLLADPDHCREIGERGRAWVKRSFDWQDLAEQLVKLIERKMGERDGATR
jgi:glycosyltransferase involved in cell wall biosynthesis